MDKPASTDHPLHPLLARRWSPRALDPRPIPPADLRSILEAARWSASSFNEQPWSFIVARREDAAEFDKLLGCLVAGNRSWAANAGALLLTVVRRTFSRNDKQNRVAEHDIGLAAASLTLQAEALGLRVHQMAGVDLPGAREAYAIPAGHDPLTAIAVGYPGEVERLPAELREAEARPRERKPQSAFVYAGAWGAPARW